MNRIVIIGCGCNILKTKKRDFIDDSTVVRMNNFRIDGYEDYVGTRTDMYACSSKYLNFIDTTDEYRNVWCEELLKKSIVGHESEIEKMTHSEKEEKRRKWISVNSPPKVCSETLREILYVDATSTNDLKHIPFFSKIRVCDPDINGSYSTGLKTILYYSSHYKDHQIFITGFDNFLLSGWYWDVEEKVTNKFKRTQGYTDGHPYFLEREMMVEMIKNRRIIEI